MLRRGCGCPYHARHTARHWRQQGMAAFFPPTPQHSFCLNRSRTNRLANHVRIAFRLLIGRSEGKGVFCVLIGRYSWNTALPQPCAFVVCKRRLIRRSTSAFCWWVWRRKRTPHSGSACRPRAVLNAGNFSVAAQFSSVFV